MFQWRHSAIPVHIGVPDSVRTDMDRAIAPHDLAAAVAHGFRSSFRDWGAEETLAHVVQNNVEAAYARLDLFERRRRLMDDWASAIETR